MGHGASPWGAPRADLDAASAETVAVALQVLAAPVRLLILTRLRRGPGSATELAEATGMRQSAMSHQLRLLRDLGLVSGARSGQRIVYSLSDGHVAGLLDETVYHVERLRLSDLVAEGGAAVRSPAG